MKLQDQIEVGMCQVRMVGSHLLYGLDNIYGCEKVLLVIRSTIHQPE